MEHLGKRIAYDPDALHRAASLLPVPAEKVCFFDIETTGLSPRVSSLFLVGAVYLQEGHWHIEQWFADDYTSEEEILHSFAAAVSAFDTVVHYNGSTFDIPYLEKKYRAYHMPSPFAGKNSFDLYRRLSRRKSLFPTQNKKLATMEKIAGFSRRDTFSGKDCIQLYTDYMQKKYFRDPEADIKKKKLLLHNHDDLIGTIFCSSLLSYLYYNPMQPTFSQHGDTVYFTDTLAQPVPLPLSFEENGVRYEYKQNRLCVSVSLRDGTLYHYFPDYENYYYLPKEDMAVHKSVGSYVAPAFREKAKASNCYIKKTGTFLPLPGKKSDWSAPVFYASRRNPVCYLAWEEDATLSETDLIRIIKGYVEI